MHRLYFADSRKEGGRLHQMECANDVYSIDLFKISCVLVAITVLQSRHCYNHVQPALFARRLFNKLKTAARQ
jgi:hypothetical protein